MFSDEEDGFTKKANRIAGYCAVLRFLDRYLKDAKKAPGVKTLAMPPLEQHR